MRLIESCAISAGRQGVDSVVMAPERHPVSQPLRPLPPRPTASPSAPGRHGSSPVHENSRTQVAYPPRRHHDARPQSLTLLLLRYAQPGMFRDGNACVISYEDDH